MRFIFIATLLIISSFSFCQSYGIEWQRCLGGTGFNGAYDVQQTNDDGFILAGQTWLIDQDETFDYLVIKTDSTGILQWQKSFGGSKTDQGRSVQKTYDNGYIIAGSSDSKDGDITNNHGKYDYWVIKLNEHGEKEWEKSFGGYEDDKCYCIYATHDSGYILCGYSSSKDGDITNHHGDIHNYDCWIVKINNAGDIIWENSFGGTHFENATSIIETNDKGFAFCGYSDSNDGDVIGNKESANFWIVKLDSAGNLEWQKTYDNILGEDRANSIKQTFDSGYIVAGVGYTAISGPYTYDYWVLKLDTNGDLEWQKKFGGTGHDEVYSVIQTKSGGYTLLGKSNSTDGDIKHPRGDFDFWALNLDAAGNIVWNENFGGSSFEYGYCILQTKDGNYILTGETASEDGDVSGIGDLSDVWLVKLFTDEVLPVNFTSFTASSQQNKVVLSWATSNETNNDYFSIERSDNNKNFISAGTVYAKDKHQTTNNYFFTDSFPLNGTSYYRIKQYDKNGRYTYSSIVPVTIATAAGMIIQPNPSKDGRFTIHLGNRRNNISVSIAANSGKVVYYKKISSAQNIDINLFNKISGVYYINITYDGGEDNGKLVIE